MFISHISGSLSAGAQGRRGGAVQIVIVCRVFWCCLPLPGLPPAYPCSLIVLASQGQLLPLFHSWEVFVGPWIFNFGSCNWLGILHNVSKIFFFFSKHLSTSLNWMLWFQSLEHGRFRVVVERLVRGHLDNTSQAELRHENVAQLPSTVQNGGNCVQILGFLEPIS